MSSSCNTYVGPFLVISGPHISIPDELESKVFSPREASLLSATGEAQQVLLPNSLDMPGKVFDRNSEPGVHLPNPQGEVSKLLSQVSEVLAYVESQPGARVTPQWGVVTWWD